jgi:hypothetical protein
MKFNPPIFVASIVFFVALIAAALFGYLLSQFIRGFLPLDVLTFLVTLFLLAVTVLLIYILLRFIRKQRAPSLSRTVDLTEPMERSLEEPFFRQPRVLFEPTKSPEELEREGR